jgi:CheY-like chemotaxis protein
MDGLEATRAIRVIEERDGRAPTPIIAMSAGVLPEEVQACRAAGVTDFVPKPVRRAELLAALHKWLGGGGAARIERASDP